MQRLCRAAASRSSGSAARGSSSAIPGLGPAWRHAVSEPACADIDVAGLHQHYLARARARRRGAALPRAAGCRRARRRRLAAVVRPRRRGARAHAGRCGRRVGRSGCRARRRQAARHPAAAAHGRAIAHRAAAAGRPAAGARHLRRVLFQARARPAVAQPARRDAVRRPATPRPRSSTSRWRSTASSRWSTGGSKRSSTSGRG